LNRYFAIPKFDCYKKIKKVDISTYRYYNYNINTKKYIDFIDNLILTNTAVPNNILRREHYEESIYWVA